MSDTAKVQDVVKDKFRVMATEAFLNNGIVEDGKRVKIKDLLSSTDATLFLPKVISSVVKEAVEPVLTISTNLFQTIRLNAGRSIEFPAIGALTAEEIPEGGSYPEKQLDMGSGNTVSIAATKVGVMVRVSEEMIEDSQWDIIGLHLRAAGRALARKKETLCANLFSKYGYKIFDNVEKTAAVIGETTGRDIKGEFNGTLHLDDLFDMIAYLINSGFTPRTILMHPLAWLMLAKNPMLRELAWMQNNNYWGGTYSGKVGETGWDASQNLRYKTIAPNLSTTQTALPPGIFPVPLRVLVSPYVRFIPKGVVAPKQDGTTPGATKVTDSNGLALAPLTDIYIVDDPEGGLVVQRDDISTEHFDDPARDIKQMKIRERYGLGILSQGKSVVVARNVAIQLSYVFNNMNAQSSLTMPDRNI